jgi:lysozyme
MIFSQVFKTIEFYDRYLQNQFLQCPIWIRNIYSKPVLSDKRNWVFWQYANRGHLKGINGYVDLNVFNGNEIAFQKLINKVQPLVR